MAQVCSSHLRSLLCSRQWQCPGESSNPITPLTRQRLTLAAKHPLMMTVQENNLRTLSFGAHTIHKDREKVVVSNFKDALHAGA